MARLQRELGAGDRVRVGQYLDSVREVERRIQRAEQSDAARAARSRRGRPACRRSWEDHVRLMFDLQVLALQADITRVITFQMARETSTRTYPQIGVPEPHHPVSHHTQRSGEAGQAREDQRATTCRCSPICSRSCRRRRTATDRCSITRSICSAAAWATPTSTITRTCRSWSRADAAASSRAAGTSGSTKPTPLANLHLTLLDKVGVHLDTFVDSTGRISDLEPLNV